MNSRRIGNLPSNNIKNVSLGNENKASKLINKKENNDILIKDGYSSSGVSSGISAIDLSKNRDLSNKAIELPEKNQEQEVVTHTVKLDQGESIPLAEGNNKESESVNKNLKTITVLHTNDLHGSIQESGKSKKRGGDFQIKQHQPEITNGQSLFASDYNITGHGQGGGMAKLASVVDKLRQENPESILVDAGDIAYRPPYSDRNRFNPMPELMNKIGYDILAPGNHEYQWEAEKYGGVYGNPNPELIDNLHELSDALNFPVVNCNTVLKEGFKSPDFIKPFVIKELNGVKVGITGVVTKKMATSAHPLVGDNWEVINSSDSLKKTIPQMKESGADVVVVLSHDNLNRNRTIIENTPGIDVVIGAHDHQFTAEPIIVKDPQGKKVPLVEASSHTKNIGELDISFDPDKKRVTEIKSTMHPVKADGIEPDPEIAKIVEEWASKGK